MSKQVIFEGEIGLYFQAVNIYVFIAVELRPTT
jgi:hypothetical protein